jgi:hypothetical protein
LKPIEFPEQTVIYAKDQPEYIPLPVHKAEDGTVTSCWQFTWRERIKVLFGAKLFWSQMTFHQPLQPVMPNIARDFSHRHDHK